MDSLFDLPESKPRWKELAEVHGIEAVLDVDVERRNDEDGSKYYSVEGWIATIHWFGKMEHACGQTEKQAVVALIHQLKLTGWETVSIA
jgi:hypothetical protein